MKTISESTSPRNKVPEAILQDMAPIVESEKEDFSQKSLSIQEEEKVV